ncbi:UrcA family protein [Sphingomonas sp. Root710]|uniref:UrcA family protein n=1 Tax=Sphingomonas sp. Root710 TaxID=1736594 RepID=UPI00138F7A9B|nr:UrcA family protein [Sphingomonas sp. Root710]
MIKSLSIMLALAASLPAAAMAADDSIAVDAVTGTEHRRTVDADDLNLANAAGQAALRTRISYAVHQVCGTAGATGALLPSEVACNADASAKAQRQAEALIAAATRQAHAGSTHSAN